MRHTTQCIGCLVERQLSRVLELPGGEEKKTAYMKEALRAISDAPEDVGAPYVLAEINKVFKKYYGDEDRYRDIKRLANEYALSRAAGIRKAVTASEDRLLTALKFALVGNYLDFGALKGQVDYGVMDRLIEGAPSEKIDETAVKALKADLAKARSLVYITDNAGEIVLDALFLETVKELYPELALTVAVRGGPVINDATREDAEAAGIDRLARVLDPENLISGLYLPECGRELREAVDAADVLISKGQGNFEMLSGCGLNVYYIFLCKCELFTELFGLEKLSGVVINEKDVNLSGKDR